MLEGRNTGNWRATYVDPLMTLEERRSLIGNILERAGEADSPHLMRLIESNTCPDTVRCAAIERYAQLHGTEAIPILENYSNEVTEREVVRYWARMHLRELRPKSAVERQEGPQRPDGEPGAQGEEQHEPFADESLEQPRWVSGPKPDDGVVNLGSYPDGPQLVSGGPTLPGTPEPEPSDRLHWLDSLED